ncbi:HGxxPAAW family protein [Streptomyces sp. NPDC127113]|uniref:HGxxPAAW family protein n=1 Tax=Streptomyces sp. NPDC127113 TaxID=3345365 RepID=UPI0036351465
MNRTGSGHAPGHDHGHTVAGWTGTGMALAGSVAVGGSMVAAWYPGLVLGAGLVALSACTTWVLHLAGWGKPGGPRPPAGRGWRVRDRSAAQGHPGCVGCRLAGRGRRTAAPAATVPAAGAPACTPAVAPAATAGAGALPGAGVYGERAAGTEPAF